MKYKIKSTSIFFFVLIFILIMLSIAYLTSLLWGIIENKTIAIILSIFAIGFSYFIALKLTSGIAEISLNSKQIEFNWVEKPIFTLQNNTSILNKNLSDWSYRNVWIYYDYIKLYDSENQIVVINLFNPKYGHNDDFYKLRMQLNKRLNKK